MQLARYCHALTGFQQCVRYPLCCLSKIFTAPSPGCVNDYHYPEKHIPTEALKFSGQHLLITMDSLKKISLIPFYQKIVLAEAYQIPCFFCIGMTMTKDTSEYWQPFERNRWFQNFRLCS